MDDVEKRVNISNQQYKSDTLTSRDLKSDFHWIPHYSGTPLIRLPIGQKNLAILSGQAQISSLEVRNDKQTVHRILISWTVPVQLLKILLKMFLQYIKHAVFLIRKCMDVLPGRKKVAVITRWPYYRGGRNARFRCTYYVAFCIWSYDCVTLLIKFSLQTRVGYAAYTGTVLSLPYSVSTWSAVRSRWVWIQVSGVGSRLEVELRDQVAWDSRMVTWKGSEMVDTSSGSWFLWLVDWLFLVRHFSF